LAEASGLSAVVVIDEIDKATRDFPYDLLDIYHTYIRSEHAWFVSALTANRKFMVAACLALYAALLESVPRVRVRLRERFSAHGF
jgi:MoxR-like ATPase